MIKKLWLKLVLLYTGITGLILALCLGITFFFSCNRYEASLDAQICDQIESYQIKLLSSRQVDQSTLQELEENLDGNIYIFENGTPLFRFEPTGGLTPDVLENIFRSEHSLSTDELSQASNGWTSKKDERNVSFENGTSEKVMDLGSDSDHYSLCDGVNNELCFNHLSSDGISYCMYDPQSKTMSDPFFVDSSSSGNSMIQDGYLFVLDEQANSVQRIRLSDKEQASASFTVKEGFGAPSMRYLFDGNLMITEAQTLAADIPTDGSYDMCSYILDFDTRNCTEFTLQTPYNNRPVYVLTTIGDTCYVATDYKTYTPTSVSEDGTVSNFDYVANIYAFITKQDYINSNQNGYLMVKDAFE